MPARGLSGEDCRLGAFPIFDPHHTPFPQFLGASRDGAPRNARPLYEESCHHGGPVDGSGERRWSAFGGLFPFERELIMEKIAETQCPIHDLLRRRWSPRAFADRPVEPEKLCSLLEAARWAPSSFNEQPWFFLVAIREDREEFNRMLSCLVEGNVAWAQKA